MYYTQASFRKEGRYVNYVPGGNIAGGAVVVIGNVPYVAVDPIASGSTGALLVSGEVSVQKDASVFAAGDPIYWNPTGTPQNTLGSASSGCATSTPAGAYLMGICPPAGAALTADNTTACFLTAVVAGAASLPNLLTDPGASGTLTATKTGSLDIVTAGAETRTIAAPAFEGQRLVLVGKTLVGTATVGFGNNFDATPHAHIAFATTGTCAEFVAVNNNGTLNWKLAWNNGGTPST